MPSTGACGETSTASTSPPASPRCTPAAPRSRRSGWWRPIWTRRQSRASSTMRSAPTTGSPSPPCPARAICSRACPWVAGPSPPAPSGTSPRVGWRRPASHDRRPSVTVDDIEHGKPAPDPYLLAAKMLGVDPARCVVVEDSPGGRAGGQERRRARARPAHHPRGCGAHRGRLRHRGIADHHRRHRWRGHRAQLGASVGLTRGAIT